MEGEEGKTKAEEALLKEEVNCGTLLFSDFCGKLSKIEKMRTCDEKMSLLFNRGLSELLNKQSVFPLLRLLIPINDNTRKKYGLKQATVATTYIDALHLNPASADAQRLKFWKNPSKLSSDIAKKTSGELGEVLQDVLKTRISVEKSTFTLLDVNNILDELASTSGDNQTAVIRKKILNMFSPVEQKWLMRIVFQDMKIGLKYENVLKSLNPNALQRYNECTDLRQLCSELANGSLTASTDVDGSLLSRGISLFTCFQPMLAKGFTNCGQITEVESAMKKHPFIMDLKLDGERMLCHVSNRSGEEKKGMFWSRNGNDYSSNYRSLLDDVVENVQCEACVLDGEVCAWDDSTKRFIPFGHNRTVAKFEQDSNSTGSTMRLVYVLFDILYLEGLRDTNGKEMHREQWRTITDCEKTIPGGLQALQAEEAKEACRLAHTRHSSSANGGDIQHMPLLARRALLAQAIQQVPSRIVQVRCVSVYTSNITDRKRQLESFFNQVSTEGEEGLVVKDLLSPYCLGLKSRQLMHWVKMKPEYSDMTRDLDLVILGAYFGEGKSMRGQGLSTFLCGVRDSDTPSSSDVSEIRFKSICKVGTGYSFTELEELRSKLGPVAQQWDKGNRKFLPPHFCPWRIGKVDDIPDVWIPPEHSVIVELKCAELVTSTQFSAGITCRFPRLRKIRYDKDVAEVMSIADVKEVLEKPRINASEAASRGVTGKKKRKSSATPSAGAHKRGLFHHTGHMVSAKYLVPNPAGPQQIDSVIFQGKMFCITEGSFTLDSNNFITKDNNRSSLLKYATKKNRFQLTRGQVIEVVQRNGGDVVANPLPNCFVIVGDKRTLQTKCLIDAGKNDVLAFQYIVDAVNGFIGEEDGNPSPAHFLGYTEETRNLFSGMFDELGDSFTEDIDEGQLRAIFSRLDDTLDSLERKRLGAERDRKAKKGKKSAAASVYNTESKMDCSVADTLQLSKDLSNQNWRQISRNGELEDGDYGDILDGDDWNIFWRANTIVYVDVFDDLGAGVGPSDSGVCDGSTDFMTRINQQGSSLFRSNECLSSIPQSLHPNSTRLRAVATELMLRGAKLSPNLDQKVTHVLVDFDNNYSVEREVALQNRLRELRLQDDYRFEKRIVNKKWVDDCIAQQILLAPSTDHLVRWKTTEK